MDIAILLLLHGADPNRCGCYSSSPLQICARLRNFAPLIPLLLHLGAEVDRRDHNWMTPLHLAAVCCNLPGLVELLLGNADRTIKMPHYAGEKDVTQVIGFWQSDASRVFCYEWLTWETPTEEMIKRDRAPPLDLHTVKIP